MDAVYTAIYRKLEEPKDRMTLATLVMTTPHWLSVSKRTWEGTLAQPEWIRNPVETVWYLYRRLFPRTFCVADLAPLRHLTIYQLKHSSTEFGMMAEYIHHASPMLRSLSVTFAESLSDHASLGPLTLPGLTHLTIQYPSGSLEYHHGTHTALESVTLHAKKLIIAKSHENFPSTCTTLSLHSTDDHMAYLDTEIPQSVETLDIITKGIVYPSFWGHSTALVSFTCICDTFIIDTLIPDSLMNFKVDASVGIVGVVAKTT